MTVEAPDGLIYADKTTYEVGREDLSDMVLFPDTTPIELLEYPGLEVCESDKPVDHRTPEAFAYDPVEFQTERPVDYTVLTGGGFITSISGDTVSLDAKERSHGEENRPKTNKKQKKLVVVTQAPTLW